MLIVTYVFRCDLCGKEVNGTGPAEVLWGVYPWTPKSFPLGWRALCENQPGIVSRMICDSHEVWVEPALDRESNP